MVHARLLMMVALVAGLPLFACSGATETPAGTDAGVRPMADAGTTLTKAQLRSDVRDVFIEELQWSRLYAMSALAHGADANAAFSKLMQSEDAIAAEVMQFYGPDQQAALSSLLHARAQALAGTIAQLNGRRTSTGAVVGQDALYANGDAIAQFFTDLSPYAWFNLEGKLHGQIDAIVDGFDARAAGDEKRSVNAFDTAEQRTLVVADTMTEGLGSLFVNQLAPSTSTPASQDFRLGLRLALDDHAFWLRAWMMDFVAQRSVQAELDRATQSSFDIANAFASLYGTSVTNQFQWNFHNDTADAVAFVFARETGDPATIDRSARRWLDDANRLSQLLTTTLPTADASKVQRLVETNFARQRAMIDARFTESWDADATRYVQVIMNLDALSDTISDAAEQPVSR